MLWYKAWLDTRTRFVICLIGMIAFCTLIVVDGIRRAPPWSPAHWYYEVFHRAHLLQAPMWIVAVTLLLMGGLLRERASGVSSFTLALPASRGRLMGVRIAAGLMEAVALAIIPGLGIFIAGCFGDFRPSIPQECFHLLLLVGGGLVFFAIAFLVSSLVEGEYTAPLVTAGVVLAIIVALARESLRPYNPVRFMLGFGNWDSDKALLAGPIPWMLIANYALVSAILIVLAVKVIQRRDF